MEKSIFYAAALRVIWYVAHAKRVVYRNTIYYNLTNHHKTAIYPWNGYVSLFNFFPQKECCFFIPHALFVIH